MRWFALALLVTACLPEQEYQTALEFEIEGARPHNFPIDLLLRSNMSDELVMDVIEGSVWWNELTGLPLLNLIITDDERSEATCGWAEVRKEELGGTLGATRPGACNGFVMFDRDDGYDGWQDQVVRHELGHLLGLSHNEEVDSLMYYLEGTSYRVYDHEIELLKSHYSRRENK